MKEFPAVLDEESLQRGLVWLVESNESFDAVHERLVSALRGEFHFALTCSHGEDQPLAAVA